MSDKRIIQIDDDAYTFGKTVHGTMDERGRFVPYPDDYVPPPPGPPTAIVTAIDVEAGTITIDGLVGRVHDIGGRCDTLILNPDRLVRYQQYVARLAKKVRRLERMARKRRRGWA